jgi:hypothetical protein
LQLSSSYTGALCQGLETGQVEDKPTIRYTQFSSHLNDEARGKEFIKVDGWMDGWMDDLHCSEKLFI